ncbi:hypothetical protein [Leptolyngbya ohadii]|uniref:hypothetical protein n=1 Tax=Leptolyngbya ohadii TaxID=1962290 RepID=UPI000B59FD85|nr:hypothetical protein [Leptolyngbya ohadii]
MKQGIRQAIKTPAIGRSAILLILIWLLWAVGILGFQAIVSSRLAMILPDRVLFWTESAAEQQSPYLRESFLPAQTGWDSEYYLSIAQKGYDDPQIRTIPAQPNTPPALNRPLPLNYAFFPVYPHLMRWLGRSLMLLGMPLNDAVPLAGVMISLLGTLAGCFALYDLARSTLGAAGAMRSVFYLLIFPTSFFLAQVYTEGLFIGLAFGSLALTRRKHWALASLLATIATLTRAVGVLLVIPLLWEWGQTVKPWQILSKPSGRFDRRQILQIISTGILLLAPAIAHLLWRFSFWGRAFQLVQTNFFRCEFLAIGRSCAAWGQAFLNLWGNNSQTSAYYAIELILIGLGLTACMSLLRRDSSIALFSAAVILISITCGLTWSLSRYLLTVPALFLMLGNWSENAWFDRLWTVMSALLLALLTIVFTLGGWAG